MTADLQQKLKHYRISESEYQRICDLLGRPPRSVEWAVFSALWSEHCSYKSSKVHLKKFGATLTPSVVTSQGENAGIVDLGQGEKVVFKMESHNHPSFIEPYQGAATGVGGILRDIFTMGARPIASADYLCFGDPEADRMTALVDGVVRGISGYGNCVGVPTVTGRTQFDPSYNRNILVNAMSVGLLTGDDPVALSGAKGPGNDVVYVGAKTGKDGVHGAAMASESFDEDSEAKKPNVQIGDPFFEKLLIESCLEVIRKNLVVSIQDMGAAGLTSSSFEMSSKGGLGFDLHLDRVPLRDSSVGPEEILLSESQERMLLICEPRKFSELAAVFERWGLEAVRVGQVRREKEIRIFWKGELLTEIDPQMVVDQAPAYERPYQAWDFPRRAGTMTSAQEAFKGAEETDRVAPSLQSRLASARFASREAIYRQYDQRVGGRTSRGADHQVAVLRLPRSGRGLMIGVGCRADWMKRDARYGALDAVLYPVLQMAVKGGIPIGLTDCLNFGNPERLEIMSEFVASVEAIRDASLALEIPVISGNVSFYNETQGQGITSTPAVGVVGVCPSVENLPEDFIQGVGSILLRLEIPWAEAEGENKFKASDLPLKDLVQRVLALRKLSTEKTVRSTQVVGEGGLAWTLALMGSEKGAPRVDIQGTGLLKDRLYQAVFEVESSAADAILAQARKEGLVAEKIGTTQKNEIEIGDWKMPVLEFRRRRRESWRKHLEETF